MQALRTLDHVNAQYDTAIRYYGTLILVVPRQDPVFDNTRGGKDAIIEKFDPTQGHVLMWAWVDQWKTDIFNVTRADLDRLYERVKK